MSGMHRSVELALLPSLRITDYFVTSQLIDIENTPSLNGHRCKSAILTASVKLECSGAVEALPITVEAALFAPGSNKRAISRASVVVTLDAWSDKGQSEVKIQLRVAAPFLWSAENPVLYKLVMGVTRKGCKGVWESTNGSSFLTCFLAYG